MVFPIAVSGAINSTLLSCEVALYIDSADTPIPGDIAPPKYSPFALTASNTVAVPRSTIIAGPFYQ